LVSPFSCPQSKQSNFCFKDFFALAQIKKEHEHNQLSLPKIQDIEVLKIVTVTVTVTITITITISNIIITCFLFDQPII
jgi:hypothetical protein